jgi:hypothetical protein
MVDVIEVPFDDCTIAAFDGRVLEGFATETTGGVNPSRRTLVK